jgi:hypothetical protein
MELMRLCPEVYLPPQGGGGGKLFLPFLTKFVKKNSLYHFDHVILTQRGRVWGQTPPAGAYIRGFQNIKSTPAYSRECLPPISDPRAEPEVRPRDATA